MMSTIEEWIEEFLYRGRPPSGAGADEAPAWHVVIGQQVDSPFGGGEKSRRLIGPLPIGQAEQVGWPLSRLFEGINAEAVKRVNELEQDLADRVEQIAQLMLERSQLEEALAAAQAALAEANSRLLAMDQQAAAQE